MDELSVVTVMSSYNPMDHMQGVDHFGFVPFQKGLDEVGTTSGETSTGRNIGEMGGVTCDEHDLQRQQAPHHVTQHHPHDQ
ncbi:hypothetical protein R6Q57_018824 [Mikania cordata]